MRERGHAAVELALAVGLLLLPSALAVLSFAPWSSTRVDAEAIAAEAARYAVLHLDQRGAEVLVVEMAEETGLDTGLVRMGWCGAASAVPGGATGSCPVVRGGAVSVTVELWTPLLATPWGEVGGLWVSGEHSEPIDLYRSLP